MSFDTAERKQRAWTPEMRDTHSRLMRTAWSRRDDHIDYGELADPERGLGYLDRGVDVPRTFEQSLARARDRRRRVRKENWSPTR